MTELGVAAVQLRASILVVERPRAVERWLSEAAALAGDATANAGARLFVFPEGLGRVVVDGFATRGVDALSVLRGMVQTRSLQRERAVRRALIAEVDRLLRAVFARLARRHRATVVAGSWFRPHELHVRHSSYTFDPSGRLVAITDQVNLEAAPARAQRVELSRGDVERVPIVTTRWGRLATLVGYDSRPAPLNPVERFTPVAPRVIGRGAQVLAVPGGGRGFAELVSELDGVAVAVAADLCGGLDDNYRGSSRIWTADDGALQVAAAAETDSETEVVFTRVNLSFDGE